LVEPVTGSVDGASGNGTSTGATERK
jgi:hypothetical protein